MSILLHGDCLEEMKGLDDNSIDLIFCDLPYGQTSCKWDCCIDLEKFWIEVMRIKKLNTPIFFTTTTKFGVSLINSAPKKCHFRYDIVWVKSSPAGFLSAKKMPMRKHEMVYVFYEKLPFYDLSSHTHKFIKEEKKEELCKYDVNKNTYGGGKEGRIKISKDKKDHQQKYDPPLPVSVVKEEMTGGATGEEGDVMMGVEAKTLYGDFSLNQPANDDGSRSKYRGQFYEPPLPVSVVKEETKPKIIKDGAINEEYEGLYGGLKAPDYICNNIERNELRRKYKKEGKGESSYEPPLPVSVVKEDIRKDKHTTAYGDNIHHHNNQQRNGESIYDPPLPNSMLEVKSTRGKHSTEKPVALMEWVLKYYSKEGDTILDPTMGSGSTGVACKNMNRNFIGIEMDDEIYEVAVNRIEE